MNSDATFELVPVSVKAMEQRIEAISTSYPYVVWEEHGDVLGYAYAHPWKERAAYAKTYETTVYVAPDSYRKGIGTGLMTHLINELRKMNVHALIACITGGNFPSIALHKRLGFVQVSSFREVGEKFGRQLDVVDLELLL